MSPATGLMVLQRRRLDRQPIICNDVHMTMSEQYGSDRPLTLQASILL